MIDATDAHRDIRRAASPMNDANPGRSAWRTLGSLRGPVILLLAAAIYLALAQLIIWLNDPVQLGAGFWPAAGVSLAMLLLLERRTWPWVLGGVALAEFGGDLLHGYRLEAIWLWTIGNVAEPLVGALLIRRFSSEHGALTPLNKLIGFIAFGVVVGPLVGATIGSLGTILFYETPATIVWPKYVIGDALGVLVVAPILLTWTSRPISRSRAEALTLGVSAIVVTVLVFRNWDVVWDVTLPYLILPFLTWAGLRFGLRGAAWVALAVANIANLATALGYGPFAMTGGTAHAVTLLQVFLGITLISSFVLAALVSELTDSRETARLQAEGERNREFRDAFMGVLSHEIRSPVTTIYGMSQLLRGSHGKLDDATVGQYLDDIGSESDRLRRLTEDMLILSRAEGGSLVVAADPMRLGHVVRTTVQAEAARLTGHEVTLDVAPDLPLVLGEDGYVEQIIRNFLSNAAKYSPSGTCVRVTVASESGGVVVRVTDQGPGLPEGPSERLFDLFYRAPGGVASSGGAGIGLFVCRKLVEGMGGRVWATPAAGSDGAEFGFWLPAARDGDVDET